MCIDNMRIFMAREAHPQRTAALISIREHVARLGTVEGQRAARELFPAIGKPTWEGWCRVVRLGDRADVEPLAESFAVTTRPITPITAGVELRGFEFDQRIAEMDAAARALIDVAWPVDPETRRRGRVKNPMLLKAAHAALAQTAGLVVKHQEAAWSYERCLERMEELVDTASAVLKGAGDRELTGKFIQALGELEARWANPGHRYGRGVSPARAAPDF
ncbi:hypothetical protein OI25_606 [Paraburkholderia fungorum]|uniref:DUF3102 domain-containing protein n=1 Tax=Paraburkholderia fungorum TaxID=134537 RepID=A0AAU8TA19_9BURK|nr:hypothetical protein [Paraburkholderia fungorum]AJZ60592.1 hypothetical protein OI25_606 [Paraburkholderia fungorum]